MQWKQITSGVKVQHSAILLSTVNWLLIISSQRADSVLVEKRKEAMLASPKESQKAEQGGITSAEAVLLNDAV